MSEFAERRISMQNDSMMPISIEEFAAYLDGNLSLEDMNRVTSLIENNPMLHSFAEDVQMVDETFANYTENDIELPSDISSMDFCIPQIDINVDTFNEVEELQVAACMLEPTDDIIEKCDDDNISIIGDRDLLKTDEMTINETDEDSNNLSSSDDIYTESIEF